MRFTAFERPAISRNTKNMYSHGSLTAVPPTLTVVVRTPRSSAAPPGNATLGVTPQKLTASTQNATEIRMRPAIFCEGVRPSERLCATLSMSSRRPSEPVR